MNSWLERAYRFRGVLMAPPYLVLLLVFTGETERDTLIWPIGLALFTVGLATRVWAQIHLHYRLRLRKKLTVTGPYAFVRNPIYIANTLMLLGLTVLSELLWFLPVMCAWCCVVYSLVVRREEAHLSAKYGRPYEEYRAAVSRWIPGVRQPRLYPRLAREFLVPSLIAEAHCLLLLLPLLGKDLVV